MKRILLLSTLLVAAAWSADYSSMSTDELFKLRGSISSSERPAFKAEMQKRMQGMSMQERQQMMQGKKMGMGKGMQNRPKYTDLDLNKDGKVTKKEFNEARTTRMTQKANEGKMMKHAGSAPTFESIDTNGDGILSQSEFTTQQAAHMKIMRSQKSAQ